MSSAEGGSNRKLHLWLLILFLTAVGIIFIDDLRISSWDSIPIPEIFNSSRPLLVESFPNVTESNQILTNVEKPINSITNKTMYKFRNMTAPAVYLRLKGGLGNQLFQYACHYAVARKNNWPLYTFISSDLQNKTKDRKYNDPKTRSFTLDHFDIPFFDENSVDESWNVTGINFVSDGSLLSGLYPDKNIISLSGGSYCQSEAFFAPYREEVKELFRQKIQVGNQNFEKWRELIESTELSVAIHIRRGDFARVNLTVPLSYYEQSMAKMAEILGFDNLTFFVFSDDISFAKNSLLNASRFGDKILIVSDLQFTNLEEFYLMSRCKHDIIPNSSFGWWGAYLNPNQEKKVIAAHQNLGLFDYMYPKPEQQQIRDFNKWEFRHLYYPYDWIMVDPFS